MVPVPTCLWQPFGMADNGDGPVTETISSLRKGSSVSELVKNYDDGAGKRDRSESGDSTPRGKRRPPDSSPRQTAGEVKELIEDAVEEMESHLSLFLSKELHEFKQTLQSKFEAMNTRIKDLEDHVNEKDLELERMASELKKTQEEVRRLSERSESAEMNSRIPCLILSGRAMRPHRDAPLGAPLQPADRSALQGAVRPAGRHGPDSSQVRGGDASGDSGGGRGGGGGSQASGGDSGGGGGRVSGSGRSGREGEEDIIGLVVDTIRRRFHGLDITDREIDRAHRLPGPNNRVIVRFVRSGSGSVREQLMSRRMELRGSNDLYINESLTAQKSRIFRSLLEEKKKGKIYTVYTRWGHVFYKSERFGTSARVESLEKVGQLGFTVRE